MENYIKSNNFDIAIIDRRGIDETKIELNPIERFILLVKERKQGSLDNLIFRFTKICRDNKIPILMMPHGPYPLFGKFIKEIRVKHKTPFRPDYLIMSYEKEVDMYQNILGLKDTYCLGDPRYDINWINYLQSIALRIYKELVKKPKGKKTLLYTMDITVYDKIDNEKYKLEIHKDIISLVNEFKNLTVWVKHHPRKVFNIPVETFVRKDRLQNVQQFGNTYDTNGLMVQADICLTTSSTTLINPVLQKRPAILYDRWKEKLDGWTIYEGLKYNASNRVELVKKVRKILEEGYIIEDSYLTDFYKKVFSISDSSVSMTELYIDKLKELMLLKK